MSEFVVCPKCRGNGSIHLSDLKSISICCDKCDGTGKLDWIENIVGKHINHGPFDDPGHGPLDP